MIATARLYLTADRRRVVLEGNPAAAFLLVPKGIEIPKSFEGMAVESFEPPTEPTAFKTKETAQPKLRRR